MGQKFNSTVQGAASGAAAGSMLGPWGTLGGAVVGGGLGYLAGSEAEKVGEQQQAAYGQAAAGQRQVGQNAYDMYSNLNNSSQSYYSPARSAYDELYGGGTGSYGGYAGGGYGAPLPLPQRPVGGVAGDGWHTPLGSDGYYHAAPVSGGTGVTPTGPSGAPTGDLWSQLGQQPTSYSMRSGTGGYSYGAAGAPDLSSLTSGSLTSYAGPQSSGSQYGVLGQNSGANLGGYQPVNGQYKPTSVAPSGGPQYQPTGSSSVYPQSGQQQRAPSGTSGMPTQSRDQYQSTVARNSGPTNSQAYFNAYSPTTYMQDYASGRQAQGISGGQLDQDYGALSQWATSGQSNATGRMNDLRNLGATSTSGMLSELAGMDPSRRIDSTAAGIGNTQMGVNAGAAQGRIASGQSEAGKLSSYLRSGQSDTGKFLNGLDVRETAGLGNTFDKLAAEGPGYMENFYTQQLTGENPAYNQLKEDFIRDSRNSAAARGGFVAGKSIDIENRGLSRLAADEFANRGNLANMAEQSRRARLGQELTGATSLDQAMLNRQQLQGQIGLGRENTLAGLASGSDSDFANLATSRDRSQETQLGLISDLAQAGDRQGLDLAGMRLQGSGQEDQIQLSRNDQLNGLATAADSTDLARRGLMVNAAGEIDSNSITRQGQLDSLAGLAGQEAFNGQQLGGQLAGNADSANLGRDTMLNSSANLASNEQRQAAKDKFDAAMRMGDAGAALNQANGAAAIGALTSADIAALDSMLAAAGVDAASRMASIQGLTNTLQSFGVAAINGMGTPKKTA